MKLYTPGTIEEATALLAREADTRALAGGQSLVAMMNAKLLAPPALVSLRRIPDLQTIAAMSDGGLRIGAMVPHAKVQRVVSRSAGPRLVTRVAASIGHPAVRNQGTIGGSLAHADPAADYPVAVTCTDATIVTKSASGGRSLRAAEFFRGYYETALEPGEIIVAVEIPPGPPGAACHYEKFSIVDGDFAVASVAVILAMDGGRCRSVAIAVGACAPKPVRLAEAEALLAGSTLSDSHISAAAAKIADACDPFDDFRGSAAYRKKIVPRIVARAIRGAQTEHASYG